MQTVSIAEAAERFTDLVRGLSAEAVVIMDGDEEIAVITSPAAIERERQKHWDAFFASSEIASAELRRNLENEGISPEDFLADLLSDEG